MKLKQLLIPLLLLLLSCSTLTFMEEADLNSTYPTIDFGLGLGTTFYKFKNQESFARLGWFMAADLNPDLSRPDWVSLGLFIGREIQSNVTVGGTLGRRFYSHQGFQYGIYLGIDLWPFN